MVLVIIFWVLLLIWGIGIFAPLPEPWSRNWNGIAWILIAILGWHVFGSFLG